MKKLIKTVVIVSMLCLCILHGKDIMHGEELDVCTDEKAAGVEGFYQEKDHSMDVLFLGDSNFTRSINPLRIWKNTGITSYTLASATQTTWTSKYLLESALKHQKPQLLIIDGNLFRAQTEGRIARNCALINAMEPGNEHIEAIAYMLNHTNTIADEKTRSVLIDNYTKAVVKKKLSKKRTIKSNNYTTHGYIMNIKIDPFFDKAYMLHNEQISELDGINTKRMQELIMIAKQHNIPVLILRVPGAREWSISRSRLVQQFAEQQEVDYLDMNMEPYISNIDWSKDTKDAGYHMNVYGAEKVSKMVGEYLQQTYDIHTNADKEVQKHFQKDLKTYEKKKAYYMREHILTDFK